MVLVIGNKRFSSWSLRPWLALTHFGIPFEEKLIPLDQPDTPAEIARHSPSGKVPALRDGNTVVWDSLAILEYLNEKYPAKKMWPADPAWRASARSISAEMHAGFAVLREVMPHDLQRQNEEFVSNAAAKDIARVKQIWTECLARSGGPFLFGDFSIADAMYAPVVNRFISYAVPLDSQRESALVGYLRAVRDLPAHRRWIDAGLGETMEAPFHT